MPAKRPNRYFHRYDNAKGKDAIVKKRQAEATPKRKDSPETWLETVEAAFKNDIGCVLDHLQVRALRRDWNTAIDIIQAHMAQKEK